jgi:hypothetical protein
MTAYQIIRDAILYKKIVRATYNGQQRLMCPHVLGRNKNGEYHALFYQFSGGSRKPLGPPGSSYNWRCCAVDQLTQVSSEAGQWRTASDHSRAQTCVVNIDVQVAG